MGSFKSDVLIAAPSERVFAALTDLANAPKLLSGVGEVQLLTPGPLGKGSRFRETRTVMGSTETVEVEISEFEPNKRYAARNEMNGIKVVYCYDVQARDSGTRVEFECQVTARGLKKLMVPIVVGVLKKTDRQHLESLKQLVESGA